MLRNDDKHLAGFSRPSPAMVSAQSSCHIPSNDKPLPAPPNTFRHVGALLDFTITIILTSSLRDLGLINSFNVAIVASNLPYLQVLEAIVGRLTAQLEIRIMIYCSTHWMETLPPRRLASVPSGGPHSGTRYLRAIPAPVHRGFLSPHASTQLQGHWGNSSYHFGNLGQLCNSFDWLQHM
jgi:hypothetical protein